MSSVHLRMHCFLAIRMLHKKLGQNVSPQTIPQCSSTQPDPVPRRTLKWPFEYQDRISVPFSLRGRFVTSLPDEFYERASEASLRLAANKSPCDCYFHLRARPFLQKKKEKEKNNNNRKQRVDGQAVVHQPSIITHRENVCVFKRRLLLAD